jgi:hypothetical protein
MDGFVLFLALAAGLQLLLVLVLVTGSLWLARRRWPSRPLMGLAWVCAGTAGLLASAVGVLLVPGVPWALYLIAVYGWATSGSFFPSVDPQPVGAVWVAGTLLACLLWYTGVWGSLGSGEMALLIVPLGTLAGVALELPLMGLLVSMSLPGNSQ